MPKTTFFTISLTFNDLIKAKEALDAVKLLDFTTICRINGH